MIKFMTFLTISLFIFSCTSQETGQPPRPIATKVEKVPVTTQSASYGSLSGTVTLNGKPPKQKELKLGGDPQCLKPHGSKKIYAGDVLVKDGLVQNVFVYLKDPPKKGASNPPKEIITIDQKGCLYEPRIMGLRVGQNLEIKNSDPLLHNVHARSGTDSLFNFAMTTAGQTRKRRFKKPQVMVHIKCDVHPWMNAFVGVLDHPYFQVTGEDGSFKINKVPTGEYTLAIWHERFGEQNQQVTVDKDSSTSVNFVFSKN